MNMRCDDRASMIREIARDMEICKLKMDGLHTDSCELLTSSSTSKHREVSPRTCRVLRW